MSARILVADDSVTIQKVVELTLSREDVELIQARSAEETIRKAQEAKPDLMLIDLSMPDKSGYEICATLRQNPLLKDVPIILLAGTFERFDEAEGYRAGANDFVSKPFDSQTLIGKVEQLLLAPPAPAAVPEPSPVPSPHEEIPLVLDSQEIVSEEIRIPTEAAHEGPRLEVLAEEPAAESIPTYELSLEEGEGLLMGEMVREEVQPAPPAEERELGVEEVTASLGIDDIPTPVLEQPEIEAAQEVQEVREAQAVPAGLQPFTIPAEMIDALAREVADRVASQIVQELKAELLDRVERVLWEVVPDLAEHLITQEIQRIRDVVEGKQ
ncbi:MAG: PleD family two-component system response regulator [Candidatus Methylomirabilales bacterium]